MSYNACIWIDPGRMVGQPCLAGTRLPLDHAAHHLAWGYTLDQYRDSCGRLDHPADRDILAAVAWWVLNDKSRYKQDRQIRKAWGEWAATTWRDCWHTDHEPEMPPALEDA